MGRYLKSFNEANITDEFLSSLQDFCEMNLVYLMDDGLQVSVVKHPVSSLDMQTTYLSAVTLRYPLAAGTFELLVQKDWNDIKDTIIPFFTRLDREYNVITFDQLPMVTSSLFGQGINNTSQVQFTSRRNLVNNRLADRTDIQTGYRKNFTVDDVISDRLDLGNNLIVEIRFYISCNDDVIVFNKMSFGSKLKKFLGFNESDFYVRLKGDDLQDELDDVCEQFLAPLADDGFTYEVRPAWNGEFDIRLSFTDGGRTNKLYDYSLVMDRFIPLVRVLSRRFELAQLVYFYSTEQWDVLKKIFTVDQILNDESPDFLVTTVKLTVKGRKDQSIVEGSSEQDSEEHQRDELRDFCQGYLAYLLDDGFRVSIPANRSRALIRMAGEGMIFLLLPPSPGATFRFYEVKDAFLPFLQMLVRDYNLHIGKSIIFGLDHQWNGARHLLSYDDVLAGEYKRTQDLYYIAIMIKDKKD
jgi:hypothetical protein